MIIMEVYVHCTYIVQYVSPSLLKINLCPHYQYTRLCCLFGLPPYQVCWRRAEERAASVGKHLPPWEDSSHSENIAGTSWEDSPDYCNITGTSWEDSPSIRL